MLPTFAVNDAVGAAGVLAEKLPAGLSSAAVRLYRCLVAVGIETARGKGYSSNVTHMVMHAPLEQVARAVGLSRVTAWRHLPALKALGLVDYRTHKSTLRGKIRNSGTVWMIRLNPASGRACRLSFADLKHRWRDMDRDIRAGRTSYRALKHTNTQETGLLDIQRILAWTLPNTDLAPVKVCMIQASNRVDLSSLFDVRHATKQERSKAVDTAAQALATALADARSVNFYRLIIHGAYRRSEGPVDYLQVLYNLATRCSVDRQEGFARRAGGLFTSRLKQAGILDALNSS